MKDLIVPLGPLLVLDVETIPDPRNVGIVGRDRQIQRTALHRLTAYSTLAVREADDGSWQDLALQSQAEDDEVTLLNGMAVKLERLHDAGGTLVTFNGLHHDVPVIRRRAQANWAFDLAGISHLRDLKHIDLMLEGPRGAPRSFPSLRDSCAGLGITMNHLPIPHERSPLAAAIRKSQCDVVGTFLLLLHEAALDRRSSKVLVTGWRAIGELLGRKDIRAPHLEQFRMHELLGLAR